MGIWICIYLAFVNSLLPWFVSFEWKSNLFLSSIWVRCLLVSLLSCPELLHIISSSFFFTKQSDDNVQSAHRDFVFQPAAVQKFIRLFSLAKTGDTRATPVKSEERGFPTDFAFENQPATRKEHQKEQAGRVRWTKQRVQNPSGPFDGFED